MDFGYPGFGWLLLRPLQPLRSLGVCGRRENAGHFFISFAAPSALFSYHKKRGASFMTIQDTEHFNALVKKAAYYNDEPFYRGAHIITQYLQPLSPEQRTEYALALLPEGEKKADLHPASVLCSLLSLRADFDENQKTALTIKICPIALGEVPTHFKSEEDIGQATLWMLTRFEAMQKEGKENIDYFLDHVIMTWAFDESEYQEIYTLAAANASSDMAHQLLKMIDDTLNKTSRFSIERKDEMIADRDYYQQTPEFKKLFPEFTP